MAAPDGSRRSHPERNPVLAPGPAPGPPVTRSTTGSRFFVRQARRAAHRHPAARWCWCSSRPPTSSSPSTRIPAIFAVTTDPFIVYTSNIFAILGLRSLYFAPRRHDGPLPLPQARPGRWCWSSWALKMLLSGVYNIPIGALAGGDRRAAGDVGRAVVAVPQGGPGPRPGGARPPHPEGERPEHDPLHPEGERPVKDPRVGTGGPGGGAAGVRLSLTAWAPVFRSLWEVLEPDLYTPPRYPDWTASDAPDAPRRSLGPASPMLRRVIPQAAPRKTRHRGRKAPGSLPSPAVAVLVTRQVDPLHKR